MDQQKTGKFIAERRKKLHLTQRELAGRLGITDRAVSKWENGRCMPELSLLEPLAKELGVGINDLLSGEIVSEKEIKEQSERNLANLSRIQYLEGFRCGSIGLFFLFAALIIYCVAKDLETAGFVALTCVYDTALYFYRWRQTKNRNTLAIGLLWSAAGVINIIAFLVRTW